MISATCLQTRVQLSLRSVCWTKFPFGSPEGWRGWGQHGARPTHPASSLAFLGCGSGSWLYTTGRWGRCGEFAGDRTSMPAERERLMEKKRFKKWLKSLNKYTNVVSGSVSHSNINFYSAEFRVGLGGDFFLPVFQHNFMTNWHFYNLYSCKTTERNKTKYRGSLWNSSAPVGLDHSHSDAIGLGWES